YFVRPGDPKKLLINFMGGGACWNQANCYDDNTSTYFHAIGALSPIVMRYGLGAGILDTGNPTNPLNGYTVIFIPYCTGDLHWGSNDTAYNSTTNNFPGNSNGGGTIHHRGFDNFLAVLKDLTANYSSPSKVFITGQSAGGYGAVFNAPYVIEAMGGYGGATDYAVVSDAAAGVTPTTFNGVVASLWGVTAANSKAGKGAASNLPDWNTGATGCTSTTITDANFATLGVGDLLNQTARCYPQARFGQYTALYDSTQTFFLNVTRIIRDKASFTYTNGTATNSQGKVCSVLWGKADGGAGNALGSDYVGCSGGPTSFNIVNLWKNGTGSDPVDASALTGMTGQVVTKAAANSVTNYSYFIGPGPVHTISTGANFYQASYGGTTLLSWYSSFVNKTVPSTVQCTPASSCQCGTGMDSAQCAPSGSN
ncbi:MAG: hypothetical protein HY042_08170, partial [Spirochaetia bacterium]|nr:hypothetical protein [Spirochaetia bacterium]